VASFTGSPPVGVNPIFWGYPIFELSPKLLDKTPRNFGYPIFFSVAVFQIIDMTQTNKKFNNT